MTENTLHWIAVAAIVVAASAVVYMWMQQSQPFGIQPNQPALHQTTES
jgi:hypothetical protein